MKVGEKAVNTEIKEAVRSWFSRVVSLTVKSASGMWASGGKPYYLFSSPSRAKPAGYRIKQRLFCVVDELICQLCFRLKRPGKRSVCLRLFSPPHPLALINSIGTFQRLPRKSGSLT